MFNMHTGLDGKKARFLGEMLGHAYFEFDPDTVNLERLQEAWEELQARHLC